MVKIISKKIELENEVVRGDFAFPKKIGSLEITAEINPQDYVLVQEGEEANSAISMKQCFNGKNYLDTNIEVLKSGLSVSRRRKFITQLINTNQALKGKGVLYDANGDLIEGKRLNEYAHKMNHNCWSWLNESFESGDGYLDLKVISITELKNGIPVFIEEPLQECLSKDCYVEVESINEQGFPTKKSPIQKYEPGKSVYFSYPRLNCASRFGAGSIDASFVCDRDPQDSYSGLGVFPCAEKAQATKNKKLYK